MSDDKLKETAAPYRAEVGEFKSEFQPLIDELYREVLEARRMSPEEIRRTIPEI